MLQDIREEALPSCGGPAQHGEGPGRELVSLPQPGSCSLGALVQELCVVFLSRGVVDAERTLEDAKTRIVALRGKLYELSLERDQVSRPPLSSSLDVRSPDLLGSEYFVSRRRECLVIAEEQNAWLHSWRPFPSAVGLRPRDNPSVSKLLIIGPVLQVITQMAFSSMSLAGPAGPVVYPTGHFWDDLKCRISEVLKIFP